MIKIFYCTYKRRLRNTDTLRSVEDISFFSRKRILFSSKGVVFHLIKNGTATLKTNSRLKMERFYWFFLSSYEIFSSIVLSFYSFSVFFLHEAPPVKRKRGEQTILDGDLQFLYISVWMPCDCYIRISETVYLRINVDVLFIIYNPIKSLEDRVLFTVQIMSLFRLKTNNKPC